jgi:hypothetical protein
MKSVFLLFVIVMLGACSNDPIDDIIVDQELTEESHSLVDSSASSISIYEINRHNLNGNISITNSHYSIERFIYQNELCEFICKSTVEERNTEGLNREVRYAKKEFYDFNLNKEFEIFAPYQEIELQKNYFISHDQSYGFPEMFSLISYESNEHCEPFVSCIDKCLIVEISNSETIAHFGYRPTEHFIDSSLQALGSITFSINQELEQDLAIWCQPQLGYDPIVNISFASKFSQDKIADSTDSRFQKLTLHSKSKKEEKAQISDFDIILSFRKENPVDNGEWEDIEHRISIINGEITGEKVSGSGTYIDMTLY